MSDKYRVEFLFKGLFLLWRTDDGIDVLAPNASGPDPCYSFPCTALRQHAFALELPNGCSWNRASFVDFLIRNQVANDCEKELLHFPDSDAGIGFRVLNQSVSEPSECGVPGFETQSSGPVRVPSDQSPNSVSHLVRFRDRVSDTPEEVAKFTFGVGCAWSERQSSRDQDGTRVPIQWIEIPAPLLQVAFEKDLLGELVEAMRHLARPLNLDLRVAMELPANEPLRLAVGGLTPLEVQPTDKDGGHVFVVHNREWAAIFAEPENRPRLELQVATDFDQEYLRKLSANDIEKLTIPVPADGEPLSPAGMGCGVSQGP